MKTEPEARPVRVQRLVVRLRELAKAVTELPESRSEFSMRVPAEPERDADMVLMAAAEELGRLEHEADFYKRRCDLLQKWQHLMRDPERTLVCDVLANGQTLPDPKGLRYPTHNSTLHPKFYNPTLLDYRTRST